MRVCLCCVVFVCVSGHVCVVNVGVYVCLCMFVGVCASIVVVLCLYMSLAMFVWWLCACLGVFMFVNVCACIVVVLCLYVCHAMCVW